MRPISCKSFFFPFCCCINPIFPSTIDKSLFASILLNSFHIMVDMSSGFISSSTAMTNLSLCCSSYILLMSFPCHGCSFLINNKFICICYFIFSFVCYILHNLASHQFLVCLHITLVRRMIQCLKWTFCNDDTFRTTYIL